MKRLTLIASVIAVFACGAYAQTEPDYSAWTAVLKKYYDPAKGMDYAALKAGDAATIQRMQPGLTGVGSIVFQDEEAIFARSSKPTHQCYREDISPRKAALETWYLEHQSFWLDLKLVFFTALVVIRHDARFLERWLPGVPREALRG